MEEVWNEIFWKYSGALSYNHLFITTSFYGQSKSPHILLSENVTNATTLLLWPQQPPFGHGVLSPYFLYLVVIKDYESGFDAVTLKQMP